MSSNITVEIIEDLVSTLSNKELSALLDKFDAKLKDDYYKELEFDNFNPDADRTFAFLREI